MSRNSPDNKRMPLVASIFVALNVISHFPIQRLHQHSTGTFPRQLVQLLAHQPWLFLSGEVPSAPQAVRP